jgi:hypothetical protein
VEHAHGWHCEGFSDFEITLVVRGRLIVKKNHHAVIRIGKRMSIAPDGEYRRWEKLAVEQLAAQWASVSRIPIPAGKPLNLRVITYLPNARGVPDLCATYEGTQDVLEAHRERCDRKCRKHAGVIENDAWVCGHIGSDRRMDANDPRVELTLTPYRGP